MGYTIDNKYTRSVAKHTRSVAQTYKGYDESKLRCSESAKILIRSLLEPDLKKRLAFLKTKVRDHKWFNGFRWDDLDDGKYEAPWVPTSGYVGTSTIPIKHKGKWGIHSKINMKLLKMEKCPEPGTEEGNDI